ncbi:Ultraviolet-B receptor like [Actinidia chinensis var. chinensis]|uniref:Ultraviolet-B receptor like n=1 Tax=Actinidia chinensis var. chinensis TaxID=1590841 RepID=A0A2R6RFC1_ACTCC|nr:Ultraviolet-B receptor like [Actinidia chinensis var. chinensis]
MEERERANEEVEEEIWSWGAGTEGQLGTGKLEDDHLPHRLLRFNSSAPISVLSCGGAHAIALTTGGRVLTWGRGSCGQLGHGEMVNSLQPQPVQFFEGLFVTHVSAGWNHSGFVTDTGCLFTCGDGSFGQLGHGDYESHSFPVLLPYFDSKPVEQVACGMRHSLVLLKGHSGDRIYGFGSGKRGQLGISTEKIGSICLPQTTIGLEGIKICSIHANGDHSAALSADGRLYTWGRGYTSRSDAYNPQLLGSSLSFVQAALGWNHALLLTGEGEVYMLGGKHHGTLGESHKMDLIKHLSENSEEAVLGKIPGLNGINVMRITAGAEHSALVTENGSVMTWGWGEHGQLGLGSTSNQTSPHVVKLGHKLHNTDSRTEVSCGSGFTLAVRTRHLPHSDLIYLHLDRQPKCCVPLGSQMDGTVFSSYSITFTDSLCPMKNMGGPQYDEIRMRFNRWRWCISVRRACISPLPVTDRESIRWCLKLKTVI